jgi:hypothetical protein
VHGSHEPYVVHVFGGLNYVEFRPAMYLTWYMAEREAACASIEASSAKGFFFVIKLSPIQF